MTSVGALMRCRSPGGRVAGGEGVEHVARVVGGWVGRGGPRRDGALAVPANVHAHHAISRRELARERVPHAKVATDGMDEKDGVAATAAVGEMDHPFASSAITS